MDRSRIPGSRGSGRRGGIGSDSRQSSGSTGARAGPGGRTEPRGETGRSRDPAGRPRARRRRDSCRRTRLTDHSPARHLDRCGGVQPKDQSSESLKTLQDLTLSGWGGLNNTWNLHFLLFYDTNQREIKGRSKVELGGTLVPVYLQALDPRHGFNRNRGVRLRRGRPSSSGCQQMCMHTHARTNTYTRTRTCKHA